MTTALIDGDLLVYAVGFAKEDEDVNAALVEMDSRLDEITFNCGASESVIYLSGPTNFRKQLFPGYKAHRKQPKPKHFQALREYLIKVEGAVVSINEEADDLLGINQTKDTIICSLDKDMLMVEGWHYNWRKDVAMEVTKAEGLHNFYQQLLTGDSTDNIPGLHGIGPVKANAMLVGCETVLQYNEVVYSAYREYFERCSDEEVFNHIDIIGKLLYIRRQPDEVWKFELDESEC